MISSAVNERWWEDDERGGGFSSTSFFIKTGQQLRILICDVREENGIQMVER